MSDTNTPDASRPEPAQDGPKPPDVPSTLQEWLWHVRYYESAIYVREKIDGKWVAASLDILTPEQWATHVARWLEEGKTPVRVIPEKDIHKD